MPRQTNDKKKEKKMERADVPAEATAPANTGRAPAPAAAPPTTDTPTDRTPMLIGALVVVILIGLSLWQLGFFAPAPIKPTPVANNTTAVAGVDKLDQPQAKALEALIAKVQNAPISYQARYLESSGGESREVSSRSDGIWTEVSTQTPLYSRAYFWSGDRTILCENNNETSVCSPLNASDDAYAEAQQMGGMAFPEPNQSARIWSNYQKLINNSIFSFRENATTKTVAGRTCQEIAYQLGENNLSVCLDQQYGVVLSQEMTYDQPYQIWNSTQILYRKTTYWLSAQELGFDAQAVPAPDVENSTRAQSIALADDEEWGVMYGCQTTANESEQRRCFKDNAISYNDVRFCLQNADATAQGDCVIKVATQPSRLRPELCEKAGEMKSDCYANIAYLKKDASYCKLVTDAALRTSCDQALANMTASNP